MRHAVDYRMTLEKHYKGTIRKFIFLNIPSGSEKHNTSVPKTQHLICSTQQSIALHNFKKSIEFRRIILKL
jgi:hypothetical protein